ncbi:hypothetical protein V8G54_034165 [Vigna mungo]|uniref:Reverse transcriptase Ty1/copia-type domain-containing protein n=1 Tax=Vigna mungo TaxID=3915 RepID=A0AAQ3MPZ2_VIGMU
MQTEYDALCRNHTWDLVPSSPGQNIVGCKWIFRIKHLPDGSIDRYKARLVAKGFHQRPGQDFSDTFSPVIKPVTVRVILTLVVSRGWSLRQLDINNAFLQGSLSEEVFLSQPPGCVDKAHPTHVCHLRKALYGLKQAPRAWYNELRTFLLSLGFLNSVVDASLFIFRHGITTLYLLVYVDDIIVTGSSPDAISTLISRLAAKFSLKDMGNLTYFLGVKSWRLLMASVPLTRTSGTPLPSPTEYRQLVGSLQYLSITRPDVAFATNKLSQFMQAPTTTHWSALKRLLRYLAGTSTHGIHISASSPLVFHAYSDADWAGDTDDYVSTTGYILYLGGTPISWSSRKQQSVARSSTESE